MKFTEEACLYALFAAPGIGRVKAMRMLEACGSAEEIFKNTKHAGNVLQGKEREQFRAYSLSISPQEQYERFLEQGLHFAALPMDSYPLKLRDIPDPPFGITWIGSLPDPQIPAVSVIGARQCSAYGREMAARFGGELAQAGAQVISGMAIGIDGLSQSAAVDAGGRSFAILGCGADICYPTQNRELYERLKENGGIISEHPPGTRPRANLFPMRNRIISAFCDILLVIEARRRSGTLITVDMALEQGRDIFALPGRVTDALSDGCHQLIRQGAGIATCAADLLEALYGGDPIVQSSRDEERENPSLPAECTGDGENGTADGFIRPSESSGNRFLHLTETERQILDVLDIRPQAISEISDRLSSFSQMMDIPTLMEILVDLCIRGIVRQENGGFVLLKGQCML